MTSIKLGVHLPVAGRGASPASIAQVAEEAERIGLGLGLVLGAADAANGADRDGRPGRAGHGGAGGLRDGVRPDRNADLCRGPHQPDHPGDQRAGRTLPEPGHPRAPAGHPRPVQRRSAHRRHRPGLDGAGVPGCGRLDEAARRGLRGAPAGHARGLGTRSGAFRGPLLPHPRSRHRPETGPPGWPQRGGGRRISAGASTRGTARCGTDAGDLRLGHGPGEHRDDSGRRRAPPGTSRTRCRSCSR